jgi:alkanesulfonate monooxygenase SsuD/methylene tetrahydromethanopterin reductase-like flavin-dependent oxidoreductase (luciferase family)
LFPAYRESSAAVGAALREIRSITDESASAVASPLDASPPHQGGRRRIRLREAHEVMRKFLAEGRIDFQGEFYRYSGLFTAVRPVQLHLPLKVGAMTGPGSFRLAGEVADGVHVACAHTSGALSFAAQNVREGADRIGRRLDSSFDLCASVLGAISSDSRAAKEAARVAAAFYISSMAPELVERHGIDYTEVRPVVDAFSRGDVERALELTTPQIGVTCLTCSVISFGPAGQGDQDGEMDGPPEPDVTSEPWPLRPPPRFPPTTLSGPTPTGT